MENVRRLTRRDFLKGAAKTAAVVAVSGVLPPIIGCGANDSDVTYDTLIRGGEVYDGMGSAPRIADIGIIGDRIVAVGNLTAGGVRIIEAQGLLVCPGFIDVHTHVDISYMWFGPELDWGSVKDLTGSFNYLFQGVTTVVGGNCGYGYPGRKTGEEKTDIGDFFKNLEKAGYGTNICTLAPHGFIRQDLFGDEQTHGLSPQRLEEMKTRFRLQMEQGTIGFSTGLEYAPGSYADIDELVALAKVVRGEYDGLYASHTRDQTGTGVWGGKGVLESIDEAITIGIEADIPVHVSHLQVNQPWGDVTAEQILEKIEKARQGEAAIDITGGIHTYDIGWGPLNYRLPEDYKSNLGIKEGYEEKAEKAINEVFEYLPASEITVLDVPWKPECSKKPLSALPNLPNVPEYEGKTPAYCFVDLLARDQTAFPAPYGYFNEISGTVKNGIIPGDHIFMSSDGFASSDEPWRETPIVHPRSFNNATRVLTKFVLPAEGAGMDLPKAIKKMTFLPAEKFKLRERGRIEEGYFADIVVIDRKNLRVIADWDHERRYSEGVEYSLVNGVLAIDNGKATDQRAGKVLRRV